MRSSQDTPPLTASALAALRLLIFPDIVRPNGDEAKCLQRLVQTPKVPRLYGVNKARHSSVESPGLLAQTPGLKSASATSSDAVALVAKASGKCSSRLELM